MTIKLFPGLQERDSIPVILPKAVLINLSLSLREQVTRISPGAEFPLGLRKISLHGYQSP